LKPDVHVLVPHAEFADAARALAGEFPELEVMVPSDAAATTTALARADAVVTQGARIDAATIASAPALKLVVKMGRVYDHIDVDAVAGRGIRLGLVARKGPICVAELATTLVLALSKDLIREHRDVATGAYREKGLTPVATSQRVMAYRWMQPPTLHEVYGKTLGCVGFGEIGCETSIRARTLGMRVLYTRRKPLPRAIEERYGVEYRSLDALCDDSDYVSVAIPHTDQTQHLINTDRLRRIGPKGYLVNVARGGVVDETALIDALRNGVIAGAGLDVFVYEPLPADSPLCTLPNVILTGHIGGGTGNTGTNREVELRAGLQEARRALAGAPLAEPIVA
jgi:phosphoglycerate dehydrogenase-like enzyme